MEPFLKMMEQDSGHRPKEENLFLGVGASGCLVNGARLIFNKGDKVGFDSPFYFFLQHDFARSGAEIVFRPVEGSTIFERVKQSFNAGEKGYMIVNPHNPTGIVFSSE
jgi:aspartate/methionine/tyrosine aminotransferase